MARRATRGGVATLPPKPRIRLAGRAGGAAAVGTKSWSLGAQSSGESPNDPGHPQNLKPWSFVCVVTSSTRWYGTTKLNALVSKLLILRSSPSKPKILDAAKPKTRGSCLAVHGTENHT